MNNKAISAPAISSALLPLIGSGLAFVAMVGAGTAIVAANVMTMAGM